MTVVHSNPPSARSRADEGSAMQRRLLQDLERQWLDSWTVADQVQAQAAAAQNLEDQPPAKDQAQNPTLAPASLKPTASLPSGHAAPLSQPMQPQGSLTPAEASAPRLPVAEAPTAASPTPNMTMTAAARETPTEPTATPASTLAQAPMAARTELGASQPTAGHGTSMSATLSERPTSSPVQTPSLTASSLQRAVAGVAQPGSTARAGSPAEPAGASMSAAKLQVADPPLGTNSRLVPGSAEEKAAPATARPAPKPSTKPDSERGPRHLMLRELNDQEVMASMRDTAFNGAQSQLAAEGLARALMEAGYARVQVVVNGQQQRHERGSSDGLIARASSDHAPTEPLTSQESRHGR